MQIWRKTSRFGIWKGDSRANVEFRRAIKGLPQGYLTIFTANAIERLPIRNTMREAKQASLSWRKSSDEIKAEASAGPTMDPA